MLSAICFNLDQSKILSSVNGLSIWILLQKEIVFLVYLPHNGFIYCFYMICYFLPFTRPSQVSMMENGENVGYQHFYPFSTNV